MTRVPVILCTLMMAQWIAACHGPETRPSKTEDTNTQAACVSVLTPKLQAHSAEMKRLKVEFKAATEAQRAMEKEGKIGSEDFKKASEKVTQLSQKLNGVRTAAYGELLAQCGEAMPKDLKGWTAHTINVMSLGTPSTRQEAFAGPSKDIQSMGLRAQAHACRMAPADFEALLGRAPLLPDRFKKFQAEDTSDAQDEEPHDVKRRRYMGEFYDQCTLSRLGVISRDEFLARGTTSMMSNLALVDWFQGAGLSKPATEHLFELR